MSGEVGSDAARANHRGAWLVALFALLAAGRVLVFSTAFPFFNPIDEHHHFDAIHKYAQLELPDGSPPTLSRRTATLILSHFSLEFLRAPDDYPGGRIPPPYLKRPGARLGSAEAREEARAITARMSTEHESPPVYYATAACWYHLGSALGLDSLGLLYWLRWMNAVVAALLVAGAFVGLRHLFPDDPFLGVGTAALLACLPQDSFYGISADPLSALLGGVAFLLLAALARGGLGVRGATLTGLAVGLAFLNKYTNVFLLAATAVVLVVRWRSARHGRRVEARALAACGLAAALPIAAWCTRNLVVLGDLTGTARKTEYLRWVPKTLAEMPDHPLFSAGGAATFLRRLTINVWRGSLRWHGELLRAGWMDVLYLTTSLAAVVVGAAVVVRRRSDAALGPVRLALFTVAAAVATLAALSLLFHFPPDSTPKASQPFFFHGRLVAGALLPLAFLWVFALRTACRRLDPRVAWGLLALWLLALTAGEVVLHLPVFGSRHNGYHALGGG